MDYIKLLADTATETSTVTDEGINWKAILDIVVKWATTTGIKLLIAIIILIISFKIINVVCKGILKKLEKKNADATLSKVLTNTAKIGLKILILLGLIGYVGIETASVSAIIASLGVGISLAVQGTLSNFAGGVIIIVMRPFKLGDFITSNNQSGTVEDIKLFYTQIVTPDNKVIYIPNGSLANNVIVNASGKDQRRVDIIMSVSYDSDLDLVKKISRKVCEECDLVLKSPEVMVEIGNYSNNAVEIYIRSWCDRPNYWKTYYKLMYELKVAYDEYHITIPYNQIDVHIDNKE
ncbi:MAG: mechanosensitive ion channel family protein [Acholeplasmatales bacterium]|nr:mechanosensitive ion channel family protein [Acholeplasmatales bacterium]